MFSVSTIYSARDFLRLAKKSQLSTNRFLESFSKYQYTSSSQVLKLVTECGWVHLTIDGSIQLSEKGDELAELDYSSALLKQLEDMILIYNPVWASFLPKGREETIKFLPDGPKQCFKEAGFTGELSEELIRIWDRLALAYRNYSNEQLLNTGRKGERLSIQYERKRTNRKPIWQSVESNLSGYDILSSKNKEDKTPLLIEVKSSTSKLNYAKFHISKNEWRTAKTSKNYILHFWILSDKPTLYIVSPDIVGKHIANNCGDGEWESIIIPYSSVVKEAVIITSQQL